MKYIFDKKTNAFYPVALQQEYENAGMWPESGVEITEEVFASFRNPPEGKMLGSDKKGNPVWVDVPPLTHEQHVTIAESQKQVLITEASQKTQLWQTQLMLDIITEEDKASLKEWMLYVQEVQAVDPSLGAGVVWPTPPASPAR
ncbi:TPA: tail fiber assembly protein [Morganella morganii]|nr:tail fiber assembly protein [Morganella morganii]